MPSIRSRVGIGLLMASVAAMSTGCASNFTQSRGAESSVISFTDAHKAGLRQKWHLYVAMADNDRVANIWRVGDRLYVATQRNELIAVDATSGRTLWESYLEGAATRISRPVELPGNQLAIVSRADVFVLDRMTGRQLSTRPMGFSVSTEPVVAGNMLGVGGPNFFYGVYGDLLNKTVLENPTPGTAVSAPPPVLSMDAKWITPAPNDFFLSRPAVTGDSFVLATAKGILWRVSASNGDWLWKDRKVNGDVVAPLAADSRAVYVPCLDQRLYAFDLNTGAHLWDARLEGRLDQPAVPMGNTIMVVTSGKGLYAVSAEAGEIKYQLPEVARVLGSLGERAYAATSGNELLMFNIDTGEKISTTAVNGDAHFVVNPRGDGLVIVATRDGRLAAFEQAK